MSLPIWPFRGKRLPWRLSEGVYLEDSRVLIPWGTSFDILPDIGQPDVSEGPNRITQEPGTTVTIEWGEQRVFGGLTVNLWTFSVGATPAPLAFELFLQRFHVVYLDVSTVHPSAAHTHRQLRELHDHLAGSIGPATFSYPNYIERIPSIHWDIPPLFVAAGPRCPRTLGISVRHTPRGHRALKKARAKRMSGEDARVNYVAWHKPYDDEL